LARPDTEDYRALFLADVPMIDLRAPVEFSRGAFPSAHSLPLMSDDERARVGTCFKQRGQAAAIELGHALVSGPVREQRMAQWLDFAREHPAGYLYCFRGGLRSATVQQWLAEAGVHYPRVSGGYKAMRRFLIDSLERASQQLPLRLVSGRTGTGKTRVIQALARSVDLEGRARHRGSAFGQLPGGQPGQIDFENLLAIDLLKLAAGGDGPVYLEDEGRTVGSVHLPPTLWETMGGAPMVVVEENLASRVEVVVQDYIVDLGRRYAECHGAEGPARHRAKLRDDLGRIGRRLGGARYQAVSDMLEAAFDSHWRSGDVSAHRSWIASLLETYYDPMYDYQLRQRRGAVLFRGSRAEVIDWARGAS
jgi:tRNA 2-selenouridine synthase